MLSEQSSFKLINFCEGDDQDFIKEQLNLQYRILYNSMYNFTIPKIFYFKQVRFPLFSFSSPGPPLRMGDNSTRRYRSRSRELCAGGRIPAEVAAGPARGVASAPDRKGDIEVYDFPCMCRPKPYYRRDLRVALFSRPDIESPPARRRALKISPGGGGGEGDFV
jgi:hypothetical protein